MPSGIAAACTAWIGTSCIRSCWRGIASTSRRIEKRLALARVERVAQSVSQQIEREHEQEDRQPWPYRHPRRVVDVVLRGVQHAAPARRRWLLSETEERETRFGDHRS